MSEPDREPEQQRTTQQLRPIRPAVPLGQQLDRRAAPGEGVDGDDRSGPARRAPVRDDVDDRGRRGAGEQHVAVQVAVHHLVVDLDRPAAVRDRGEQPGAVSGAGATVVVLRSRPRRADRPSCADRCVPGGISARRRPPSASCRAMPASMISSCRGAGLPGDETLGTPTGDHPATVRRPHRPGQPDAGDLQLLEGVGEPGRLRRIRRRLDHDVPATPGAAPAAGEQLRRLRRGGRRGEGPQHMLGRRCSDPGRGNARQRPRIGLIDGRRPADGLPSGGGAACPGITLATLPRPCAGSPLPIQVSRRGPTVSRSRPAHRASGQGRRVGAPARQTPRLAEQAPATA